MSPGMATSPRMPTPAAIATYAVEPGLTLTVPKCDVPHTVSFRRVECCA